jgi:hypothetical protein
VAPTSSPGNRNALIAWGVTALAGTVAVIWLQSYLESLVTLAETDRDAALELFRSRAIPALMAVVAIAVAAGGVLMRHGLRIVNAPPDQAEAGFRETSAEGRRPRPSPRTMGWMMACAGFVLAAVPLALISVVFWLLRRA